MQPDAFKNTIYTQLEVSDGTYSVFWGMWRRRRYDRFVDSRCVSTADSRSRPADRGTDHGMDTVDPPSVFCWPLNVHHVQHVNTSLNQSIYMASD